MKTVIRFAVIFILFSVHVIAYGPPPATAVFHPTGAITSADPYPFDAATLNPIIKPPYVELVEVGKGEFMDKADFDKLTGDQQKALMVLGIQGFNEAGQGFDAAQEGDCLWEPINTEVTIIREQTKTSVP